MDANGQNKGFSTPTGVYQGVPQIEYPFNEGFKPAAYVPVGGVILASEPIEYNVNRRTAKIVVHNTGDRPIQVGSHFHFFEVNRYLEFDRPKAFGYHLNIPATTAIRFEPGEEKEVEIVAYGGKRRVVGFNSLTNGFVGLEDTPTYYPKRIRAIDNLSLYKFKSVEESDADAEYTESQDQTNKK